MKKDLTELVFLLDRSGSMAGLEKDTIGGFHSMLSKQKDLPGEALVSTVLFDHETEILHDRVPLSSLEPMGEKDYWVRGSTALMDALGGAISHIEAVHRHIKEEDRPLKTMFIITTDGMENASRRYTADQVRKMVTAREEEGWEFLFLGANIDVVETARRYGIREDRAVKYCCDGEGTGLNYEAISDAVETVRACRPLRADWKEKIHRDFKKRSRK